LHFSTHGIYSDEEFNGINIPGYLALSNFLLSSNEVIEWDLKRAEMVVMSACETGRGQVNPDGLFGLSRAFLVAGASCVIVSLWKVDDQATRRLMVKMYENLVSMAMQGSIHIPRALQLAMFHLLRSHNHNTPLDWCPFIVTG
jgi:CHAT domain-containing protein